MNALVYDQSLQWTRAANPLPADQEALIKVSLAGICNTDIEITLGYMNFKGILGHEFVGVVEKCEQQDWVGKRVVGEINIACGNCSYCISGLQRHCPHRRVLGILNKDGAFAEYLTLPVENLHALPESVTDEEAVFVEPLAASLEILEQVPIKPTDQVLVIGDGKLGLLITQVLRLTGCELTLVGKHPEKLNIAAKIGVKVSPVNEFPRQKFPLIVEASGSVSGLLLALDLIKPRGTIILKSTFHGDFRFNPAGIIIDEITVVGSRCGPFEPAIGLLEKKLINVHSLITRVFPAEESIEALEFARQKNVLKVLLKFQ